MKKILIILPLLIFSLSACKKESIDLTKKEDALKGYFIEGLYDLQYGGNDLKLRLTVQKELDNNTPEQLVLSVNGLPAGVTANIENDKGIPPFKSNIIFTTYGAPQPGKYPVTVKLTAPNGKTFNDTFYLTIPIFDYSFSPKRDIFLYPTHTYLTPFTYIHAGVIRDILTLSFTNLPAGVTATFSENNRIAPFYTNITYVATAALKGTFPVELHLNTPSGQNDVHKMNIIITDSCYTPFIGNYYNSTRTINGITDSVAAIISKDEFSPTANELRVSFNETGGPNVTINLNCNNNTIYSMPDYENYDGLTVYTGTFSISPFWIKIQKRFTDPTGKVTISDYELKK